MNAAKPKFYVGETVIVKNYRRRTKEAPTGLAEKAIITEITAGWDKGSIRQNRAPMIAYQVEVPKVSGDGFQRLHFGEDQLLKWNVPSNE
jgi:hypothetical protein